MCQVWFHAFSVKSDQGSQRWPKGIAVYVNFSIPPSLVITQVKKSLKITYSSISPYSQHFIFSLLPTFSPLFLPPLYFFKPFLPPPYCVPPPSRFTIGCRQRSRNWQKILLANHSLGSCSYWFPSVTSQVQLQTVLLFLLDSQYFSFLEIDGRHPVSF